MTSRAPAKEFPADLEWVNATRGPQLSELRGRVILLWFWTYDCVNCWSLVPDLRFLEDKYHDGLTVVGVHCPKYPQQVAGEGVLRAVNRHRLRHAVARTCGLRRQADDRDGPDAVEQCAQAGVVGVGEAHKGNSMTWSSITKPCPMSNTRDSMIPNPYLR